MKTVKITKSDSGVYIIEFNGSLTTVKDEFVNFKGSDAVLTCKELENK